MDTPDTVEEEAVSYVEVPPTPYYSKPMGGYQPTVRVPAAERTARPEGETSSLGKLVSISDTERKLPSDIAESALGALEALPYNNHLTKYIDVSTKFYNYLRLCEQKGFMVYGYDVKKGDFVNHPLEYENRWSSTRRRELSQKLDRLEFWFESQEDRPVTMISLTSYHEGESIGGAWFKLNDSRTKLLKLIRKYFGDVDYFWVVEPHKSGYVHYHLAVFADVSNNVKDNKGKGIEDKFRDLWSRKYKTGSHTYGLDFSQKKDDQKIKSLKDYLSKYLRKGFLMDTWTPAMLVFNAHLWDTGFRMYGASKRVSKMMNIQDEKDNTVVWLETKFNDVKVMQQPDGTQEEYEEERVIWYRQYIPDWLDSDFWIQDNAPRLRLVDPSPVYIYEWGRKLRDTTKGYDPTYGRITHIP